MWYSYPGAESWIPLDVYKVREYAEMNKEGRKSQDLSIHQKPAEEIEKPVSYDYENVVGQDSLTRLDDKNKKRRKKKPKSKKDTHTGGSKIASLKKVETNEKKVVTSEEENTNANKPKKRFNRNKNRNRNKTPNNNKGDS